MPKEEVYGNTQGYDKRIGQRSIFKSEIKVASPFEESCYTSKLSPLEWISLSAMFKQYHERTRGNEHAQNRPFFDFNEIDVIVGGSAERWYKKN